ncbi:hypothetical protein V8D89_004115 [Ganoderma adspersum]
MPFWRTTLVDSSMLLPVIHTCHRLREVALAHPHLWTTFHASIEGPRLPLILQMAQWSKRVPLNAVGSYISIFKEFPPDAHFGSINMHEIGSDGFRCLQTVLEQLSSPALRTFSLFMNERMAWYPENDTLPLYPESAPNLRELTLEDARTLAPRGFPNLTHLALIDVSLRDLHKRFINFLRECPCLESIFLSGFVFGSEGTPSTPPPIPLQHLKYVTLQDFFPSALEYYVPLLQPRAPGSSMQVLAYHADEPEFAPSFLLPPRPHNPEEHRITCICIGVHPTSPTEPDYAISLTTITAHATRRLAAWSDTLDANGIHPHAWPAIVLSSLSPFPGPFPPSGSSPSPPPAADEVWLYGMDMSTFPPDWPPLSHSAFHGATRVVLAIDRRLHFDEPPSLRLLPPAPPSPPSASASTSPLAQAITITTLRLVYGCSASGTAYHDPSELHPDPSDPSLNPQRYRLPLAQLAADLRSGAYGHLRHLVLQLTPHVCVDARELGALRDAAGAARLETFAVDRIEAFPEMPGHADPAHRGCHRYPGSLW